MHVCKAHKDSWLLAENEVEEQQQKSKTRDFLCLDCCNDEVEQSKYKNKPVILAENLHWELLRRKYVSIAGRIIHC